MCILVFYILATPAASFQTKSSFSGNTKIQNSFMGNAPDTGQSQEQGSPINSLVSSVPGQMINSSANQSPGMMNNASNIGQGQARNTGVSAVTGQGQMLDSVSGMTNQGQGLMMNNMMGPDQVMNNPITGQLKFEQCCKKT